MTDMTPLGTVSTHIARPAGSGPWPAIIVIQEWWCLDDQTKSIADRYAKEGYLAAAPDLYHGERAELGDNARASELVQKYGPGALGELERVYDALKAHPDCNGKIGAVGFCFGGRMALALGTVAPAGGHQFVLRRRHAAALRPHAPDALACPGAVWRPGRLDSRRHHRPARPTAGPGRRRPRSEDLSRNSGHAFFRDCDPSVYRPVAAADAWQKSTRFFERYLKA